MKKEFFAKKEYVVIFIIVILFVCVSGLSLISINQLQGTGRVINYSGIVRGATQRLIKQEIQGHPNDLLIARLDSIIRELIGGGGANNLVALHDNTFQSNMLQIREQWQGLKEEIHRVRSGSDPQLLYALSEDYFELADRTVSSAEEYSESQVDFSKSLLLGANVIFVLFMAGALAYYLRTASLKRRAQMLNTLAYVDILTQIPNRASCEKEISDYRDSPVNGSVAVLMFDMNNLKNVNDAMGHQGGDKLISEFGRILATEAKEFGFIGRYGGDEFLGLFPGADQATVERYLMQVNTKIVSYNLLQVEELNRISFAVGYSIGDEGDNDLYRLIEEADRRMYVRKRQMKENKEA